VAGVRMKLAKPISIDRIAIVRQVARSSVPREGLGNLLCRPFRGGMGSKVEMNHSAPMMGENQEDKQNSKAQGRHHEEVGRDEFLHVIVEKSAPGLRGRPLLARHVLRDRGLGYFDTKFEQLPMDTRCSPERVRQTHLSD